MTSLYKNPLGLTPILYIHVFQDAPRPYFSTQWGIEARPKNARLMFSPLSEIPVQILKWRKIIFVQDLHYELSNTKS